MSICKCARTSERSRCCASTPAWPEARWSPRPTWVRGYRRPWMPSSTLTATPTPPGAPSAPPTAIPRRSTCSTSRLAMKTAVRLTTPITRCSTTRSNPIIRTCTSSPMFGAAFQAAGRLRSWTSTTTRRRPLSLPTPPSMTATAGAVRRFLSVNTPWPTPFRRQPFRPHFGTRWVRRPS